MLSRITGFNMQGFCCTCAWQQAFKTEIDALGHIRTHHGGIFKTFLSFRKATEMFEVDQINFSPNLLI